MRDSKFTPRRFGTYKLKAFIAAGGMAEVFVAENRVGQKVALKRILPQHAQQEEFVRMLAEEASIASALHHPNIVGVLDSGQVKGESFIAMEYVSGQPLARVIDRAREKGRLLPEALACHIAREMCGGLAHAHALKGPNGRPLGLVHRDVSPQNVLIGYGGEVKLTDFGIAKAYAAERSGRDRTRTGLVKGKYLYFSPEQARALPLDGRTDVFAAGVVLYEMLSGRLPYDGDMIGVLGRIVYGEFSSPASWRPELSGELEGIVLLAMANDREKRFPSAQALGDALGDWLARFAAKTDGSSLAQAMRALFAEEMGPVGKSAPGESAELLDTWPSVLAGSAERIATRRAMAATAPAAGQTAPAAPRNIGAAITAPAAVRPAVPSDVPEIEAPRLVLQGRWAGREFACVRTELSVGRSREADIWIDDRSLTAVHARLLFEGGAWRIQAEGSAPIWVNGARVRDGRLRSGDTLLLGEVHAHFLDPDGFGSGKSEATALRSNKARPLLWLATALAAAAAALAWMHLH